jgi:hypothetical protein
MEPIIFGDTRVILTHFRNLEIARLFNDEPTAGAQKQSPRAYDTGPVFWVARAIFVSPPFQYASSSVILSPHSAQSERSLPAE